MTRTGGVVTVSYQERSMTVQASRGMDFLAKLLAQPDTEIPVLDLVAEGEGAADGGDAGELLDDQARRAYRDPVAPQGRWNACAVALARPVG